MRAPLDLTILLVTLDEAALTVSDLLAHLRRQARLTPLLREPTLDLSLPAEAEHAGMCATPKAGQPMPTQRHLAAGIPRVR